MELIEKCRLCLNIVSNSKSKTNGTGKTNVFGSGHAVRIMGFFKIKVSTFFNGFPPV